jgi:hypothetical protein
VLKAKVSIPFKRILEFNSAELHKMISTRIFRKKGKSKIVLLTPLIYKKLIPVNTIK